MKKIKLNKELFAIVDDDDFETVNAYRWHARKERYHFYAVRSAKIAQKKITVRMHRFILGLKDGDGIKVDHRNGDGLDNRQRNLRKCTVAENNRNRGIGKNNTTGFLGVSVARNRKSKNLRWRAIIYFNNKRINLGSFGSPQEAAQVYKKASIKYHGKFSPFHTGRQK